MNTNNNDQQNKSNSDLIPDEDKIGNDMGMNEGIDHNEGQTNNGELGGNFGTGGSLGGNPPGKTAEDEPTSGATSKN